MFGHLKVPPLVLQETRGLHGVARWSYVGSVPAVLAYETDAPPARAQDLFQIAAMCGPGLARDIAAQRGYTFAARWWPTEADALAAAAAAGARVTQVCPLDPKAWRTVA